MAVFHAPYVTMRSHEDTGLNSQFAYGRYIAQKPRALSFYELLGPRFENATVLTRQSKLPAESFENTRPLRATHDCGGGIVEEAGI